MNPEQQRIKIAEACGWTNISLMPYGSGSGAYLVPKGYKNGIGPTIVPHYLKDLNAMHEAEKVLTEQQAKEYRWKLQQGFLPSTQMAQELLCHATAAERAEAFLRTLNLWTD